MYFVLADFIQRSVQGESAQDILHRSYPCWEDVIGTRHALTLEVL